MAKKRVLVDLDDTLAATQALLISAAKTGFEQNNVIFGYRDFREDHFTDPESIWRKIMLPVFDHPEIVLNVKPYKKSLDAVKLLHQNGFEVHLFSAREDKMHDHTDTWLLEKGFAPFIEHVHRRYQTIPAKEFKLNTAKNVLPSACFDDRQMVAEVLSANGFPVYLIRRPWNMAVKKSRNIIPQNSFYQAVGEFLKTASRKQN